MRTAAAWIAGALLLLGGPAAGVFPGGVFPSTPWEDWIREGDDVPLPGTGPLLFQGDAPLEMVAGIDSFLTRATQASAAGRPRFWNPDFASYSAYEESVEPNRRRFREMIGLRDALSTSGVRVVSPASAASAWIARGDGYRVFEVQWDVLDGLHGEGLLLQPDQEPAAGVIALPDCDTSPEALAGLEEGLPRGAQFARRLAENGCRVLIPALIDRGDENSEIPGIRKTNQPHREFIYRPAYELGRHVIGYEVQKVLAAAQAFLDDGLPVGVFGHGEGGLIAFYSAAADRRIRAAGVSGYFQPREGLWEEPVYRNLFGLLREFGDAEIAALIAPRALVVEAARHPDVEGPPPPSAGRRGAAPGSLRTPPAAAVEAEWSKARGLVAGLRPPVPFRLVKSGDGGGEPGCEAALEVFLGALRGPGSLRPAAPPPAAVRPGTDARARLHRLFAEMLEHTQRCLRRAEAERALYWAEADEKDVESWERTCRAYRRSLWNEVIGPLPPIDRSPAPRTRRTCRHRYFSCYETMLEVYPDVFAYGFLLVPKGMKTGEKRPVVVYQHGLEGRAEDQVNPLGMGFACTLARRGFVVYAPQNPYIGGDRFRRLQRKANPLKLSLFSFIVRQHEQTLSWLASLPFVDAARIAFYGISYGGKTALRVPAILEGYCLSICSADYNEWIRKTASAADSFSYLITGEYEIPEFNLGNTFGHAELSWLICPRPFMVERGFSDGVGTDSWVAYEYAKTRRRFVRLGLGHRTEIQFFDGPHALYETGTLDFLHRHLRFPLIRPR
jgi:dienelactone hydrolase